MFILLKHFIDIKQKIKRNKYCQKTAGDNTHGMKCHRTEHKNCEKNAGVNVWFDACFLYEGIKFQLNAYRNQKEQ